MVKYIGKRFVVFGSHLLGGGWDDYIIEHDTMKKAKLEAWHWLQDGYNSFVLDQKTNKQIEIRLKK